MGILGLEWLLQRLNLMLVGSFKFYCEAKLIIGNIYFSGSPGVLVVLIILISTFSEMEKCGLYFY